MRALGCGAWGLAPPPRDRGAVVVRADEKRGVVLVESAPDCRDVCVLSDLPLLAGLYDTRGKEGVYYEVRILRMDGVIAVGEHYLDRVHRGL